MRAANCGRGITIGSDLDGIDAVNASDWAVDASGNEGRRGRITTEERRDLSLRGRNASGLIGFQRPLLLRTVNLAKVVDTGIGLGRLTSANEVRNRDRSEEADDGHNDHDFNEGETGFAGCIDLHSTYLFCCAV